MGGIPARKGSAEADSGRRKAPDHRESFDNWYANQTLFHIVPEISLIEEENTVVSDVIPEHKEYVSIREAAECLGISEKRVYRLIQDGTLNGKKIGKAWFIRYADIASYEKED